jgi:hypothetical protein
LENLAEELKELLRNIQKQFDLIDEKLEMIAGLYQVQMQEDDSWIGKCRFLSTVLIWRMFKDLQEQACLLKESFRSRSTLLHLWGKEESNPKPHLNKCFKETDLYTPGIHKNALEKRIDQYWNAYLQRSANNSINANQ